MQRNLKYTCGLIVNSYLSRHEIRLKTKFDDRIFLDDKCLKKIFTGTKKIDNFIDMEIIFKL